MCTHMQGQIQDFHKGGMVQYISAMGKNGEGKTLQDGSAGGWGEGGGSLLHLDPPLNMYQYVVLHTSNIYTHLNSFSIRNTLETLAL